MYNNAAPTIVKKRSRHAVGGHFEDDQYDLCDVCGCVCKVNPCCTGKLNLSYKEKKLAFLKAVYEVEKMQREKDECNS
jgi:hypothetical protein